MSTLDLGKIKQLWRGSWSSSASYLPNDMVAYNGAIWICTQGHGAGASTEFSPGKRDRANVLGKTVDTAEINTFAITVQSVNSVNYFFIDGRQTPTLTLYSNVHYKFFQKDASNLNHRFALSQTIDGLFGGGSELNSASTAYTYQYSGTAGNDGSLDVVLSSSLVGNVYYFSANDTGYGGASISPTPAFVVAPAWRGYQYWDQITTGYSFVGTWSATTQYYYNNIVEYQGATYLALADNYGKFPISPMNNHFWLLMANGDRRSEHNSAGWFMNKGPVDWPYPNGNSGNGNHSASMKWISRSGRVYTHGGGDQWNTGVSKSDANVASTYPQEVTFNHADWWLSRDNGGPGRLVTPDGLPPKCIQIEAGYYWAHYLFNNGEVWGNGQNGVGYLGTGDTTLTGIPRRVQGLNDVKIIKISAGYGPISDNHHVLALDEYGYVWSWGDNANGQLGLGHQTQMVTPQRLPRSYFNGERVIDIIAMGGDQGHSYARTAQGNIWAWGYNAASQLGTGDTTTRNRPVIMSSFVPSLNNGIIKWQAVNVGANASFMLLDGNGNLWHTGADPVGAAGFAAASTRTTLTKSTAAPATFIVNFWTLWSGDTAAYQVTYIRHTNGSTYVCGQGTNANQVTGGSGSSSTAIVGPTILPTLLGTGQGIYQLVDVQMHLSYTNSSNYYRTVTWLTASGKVFSQGFNYYGEYGNPYITTGATGNQTDETGSTYYPVSTFDPTGTKIIQILASGWGGTTVNSSGSSVQHGIFFMTDSGQVFAAGQSRSYAYRQTSEGDFIGFTPGAFGTATSATDENTPRSTLVSIQYSR